VTAVTERTVGLIGLGIMGLPMAKNLLNAGYALVVHDVDREPVEELVGLGAAQASSPKEVASQSDVVITMLPDSPDVELVALGQDGVMEGIRPGSIYVDMSTISPTVAVKTAEAGAKRGVKVLDAPVSGGDVGAQKGTLSIMVGGDEDTFEEVLPIFQVLGKNIVLCGGNGAGQTVKACNQILVAITIEGVAEALVLAAKAGVDPAKVVQVLSGGLARCGVLENRGQRIVNRDFEPGFRCRLHYKDLRIAVAAGQDYDVALPVTGLVHEMFKQMELSGRGDLDHSGLVTLIEDMSQIEVKGFV
jgi:2-hydroxy-3-oxopropionate reductase